jgi:hypothetical protein
MYRASRSKSYTHGGSANHRAMIAKGRWSGGRSGRPGKNKTPARSKPPPPAGYHEHHLLAARGAALDDRSRAGGTNSRAQPCIESLLIFSSFFGFLQGHQKHFRLCVRAASVAAAKPLPRAFRQPPPSARQAFRCSLCPACMYLPTAPALKNHIFPLTYGKVSLTSSALPPRMTHHSALSESGPSHPNAPRPRPYGTPSR